MNLKSLSLLNFKNYSRAEFNFSDRINCFVGDNGVGKTNLLDAIHYLALTKSYFNAIDTQNIQHDKEYFVLQGEFQKEGKIESIYCGVQKNKKKQLKRNKKEYEKLSDHIGLIPVVMISPSDSSLILEGGEERRKFINSVICQYDRNYLENLIQYNHALIQRNKLLKELGGSRDFDADYLEVWDEQLINYGHKIFDVRKEFIQGLIPVFNRFYTTITLDKEKVELSYESQLYKNDFRSLLKNSLEKDLVLQYTTSGIHKDDLLMKLDGYPLKKVGSQGQQKTFMVALKLAKFDYIKNISGINPVLLLDDIFDKFDHNRVEMIIRLVAEQNFGQIFITDTSISHLKSILEEIKINYKIFLISESQNISETQ